ncbi:GNAT family N-acetyltransferase [Vibrio marisflavi]|uniref:N-acetyltransferase domain-containing protein n=1 Tax=Vibrio marisflavi CECT 7928 TaxID=634439 RepID=A0ABN8DZZ9_9VIBR|nr:GNAT family N-acetyltransferase [Vibrio marisflavi]CAH0536314.1 hypothetical protein VMF7928_00325 [Vibrio marisflavi CECT 7928]
MESICLQLLKKSDALDLLRFEVENKAWFEAQIQARESDFFSIEGVLEHIAECLLMYKCQTMLPLIVRNRDNKIVARVNLHSVDIHRRRALLGYRVAQEYSGAGIASKAAKHIILLAKQKFNITNFVAIVSKHNSASQKVLERNGFNRTRSFKNYAKISGNYIDCYEYILDID